ncbi:hypothetical protein SAMN05216464_101418 [Mucilaginibacter pineti]|uniref:Uncharacterized protein n=1 Tax=Mucilaginibacter pineti TaxID=1391627 RepID=A0A1G6TTZ1_9SPHI|nr:hypothetical protein [Mucilaginibacter pineti]SDD32632.1 hypothetical protein SAMN05216464_101418 [Mucilaginibacter pineti]
MSDRQKKIFFTLTIVVPFLAYCVYYYGMMIKNAPYRFSDFESMSFQYGNKDNLVNKYDSKTGDYQYLNKRDSLIKTHLHLVKDIDLIYLHRKAADLGFWDFPKNETGDTTANARKNGVRYIIEFKYKQKSKRVVFDSDFVGDPKLIDANNTLIKEIRQSLIAAESRQKK